MVTVKSGIFDSQTAGWGNPGANSGALAARGNALGAPGTNAQLNAMQYYDQMARGAGPSVAEQQLRQQAEQNQRAAMQLAGSARGGNIAGMYSQALGAQAGAQAQTNQQAAMLRAQEQQAAMAGLGALGGQAIGQELAFNALGQQGLIASGQQNIDWQLGKQQNALARDQFDLGRNKMIADTILGGVSAIGGIVGSDVRLKHDMRPASVADAAAEVGGFEYGYNPGAGPPGQQLGVSAQQLARTSLGPTLVRQGPDGMLGIDGARAGVASLAATGENSRRIAELEHLLKNGQDTSFGTREEGNAIAAEAKRRSNEIALARGRASLNRDVGPSMLPDAPVMQRKNLDSKVPGIAQRRWLETRGVSPGDEQFVMGPLSDDTLARVMEMHEAYRGDGAPFKSDPRDPAFRDLNRWTAQAGRAERDPFTATRQRFFPEAVR